MLIKVWVFVTIDNLLKAVENEYTLQQLGNTELSANFHTESIDGINHAVTVSSALGGYNISNIIQHGAKNFTGIIGNNKLSGITLVNITENAGKSLSVHFTSMATSFSNAIGKAASLLKSSVTVSQCDIDNNIVKEIYSISSFATVTDTLNGFIACSEWIANNDIYLITNSDESGCIEIIGEVNALTKCLTYLSIHDELRV